MTEKASSEAALWLTALGRGVYCVRAGPLRTGSPIFAVWRLGPVAWQFSPTHACQGVGCRCWDVSVPDGERRSCERKLGRGIRPALNLKIPLTLC